MKRFLCILCAVLLLSGCTQSGQESSQLSIVATTYPTYLAALAVTEGVEGVSVSRLDTGSVSCLHDYTLTVNDMKKLSRADIIILNGAGIESFLTDALSTSSAAVIDCSEGIDLLPATGHHDHDHDHGHNDESEHFDPHYWLSPQNMNTVVQNLFFRLQPLLPPQAVTQLADNTQQAASLIKDCELECRQLIGQVQDPVNLITFHDGFAYFAHTFDLPLLRAIEEEAGSEASAKEIVTITALIREHNVPIIFTEVNGSDATAQAIRRETGCEVAALSMLMDGREPASNDPSPITPYTEAMRNNIYTVLNGFSGTGGADPT